MKRLEIDHDGPSLWEDSTKVDEHALASTLYYQFEYSDRLEIGAIRYVENPWDWTRDEVIRTQAAAHDAMVRDNLALAENIRKLQQKLTQTYEVLRGYNTNIKERPGHAGGVFDEACRVMRWLQQLEAENKGLRGEVKQAESHYEAACKRAEVTQDHLAAVERILKYEYVSQARRTQNPVLDLASNRMAELRRANDILADMRRLL